MKVNYLQFPRAISIEISRNTKLKAVLRRLEFGSKDTPRSGFYENKKPDEVIAPIVKKLKDMKDLNFITDWDLSKIDKFAPQGNSAPFAERQDTFDEYFSHLDCPLIVRDPIWLRAKKEAIRLLKFNDSGSPASLEQVTQRGLSEDKYNTSSGFPDYGKRKDKEILSRAIVDAPRSIEDRFPCTMGSRASMGKTGVEARHIFMGSMAVNIGGQRFQQPLQDYVRKLNLDFFLPGEGGEKVQSKISATDSPSILKFGADYSKMDQHFNKYHALECFDVIKHCFKPKFGAELKDIILYVFTMPIITNLGYVDQEHSMPSGSEGTNFLETVWNFIFVIYLRLKYHLQFVLSMGIGDDQLGLLKNIGAEGIQNLISLVISEFDRAGLPGNADKQEVSLTTTGFLQRLIDTRGSGYDHSVPSAGVYSLIRNVTSQVYPEFYHNPKLWSGEMFALRVIMIAENCVNHPLFKWYVTEYVANANEHILEFVRKQNAELEKAMHEAKKIANFIPTYNQEKLDKSILDFKTVKLLREVI